ncbi:MAG TPA: hypothetical protein VG206_08700 [Terriglobia bacterium]|nr:hypothetical protein [Terriglobia bacterium]
MSPVDGSAVLPTPGNLGRNTFTGPGWWNLDFSVIKDTKVTDSTTLEFRAEFFKDICPGIDLIYYGNHRRLQYDLVIAPGADPAQVQTEFRGDGRNAC